MKLLLIVAVFALAVLILPALTVFNILSPMLYLLASLGLGMALVITLIIITIFAKDWVEPALSARFSGKSLWPILTATRKVKFVVGETKEKIFSTKEYGDYLIDPEATYMLPNGISGSIATTFYGTGLQPDMVKAATEMRKAGLANIDDLKAAEAKAVSEGTDIQIVDGSRTRSGEALRLGDVVQYFAHNLTPSYIQSVIKLSVARAVEGERKFPVWLVMGVAILLVCAGVAYVMISGAQTGSTASANLGACQNSLTSCLTRVTGGPVAATTTTVPSTPGPGGWPLPISIT